jgi:hypothetical protein
MAETTYTYTIATDFPGGAMNTGKLMEEIRASSIVTAIERIDGGTSAKIVFKDALSAGDKTILDGDTTGPAGGLIAAHDNTPYPSNEPAKTSDNVLYVTQQPQDIGFELCDRDFKIVTCKMAQADAVEDKKINPVTLEEEDWGELLLVNVYKDDGTAGMVPCTDQTDANTNGILSIWEYQALDQADGTTKIVYDIRDGALISDPSIVSADRFKHRAYAIAAPGLGQANFVRLFDGYVAGHPDGVIDAKSPQAKALNPAPAPGLANALRIYLYHPAGASHDHILRLVTYRPSGTY